MGILDDGEKRKRLAALSSWTWFGCPCTDIYSLCVLCLAWLGFSNSKEILFRELFLGADIRSDAVGQVQGGNITGKK